MCSNGASVPKPCTYRCLLSIGHTPTEKPQGSGVSAVTLKRYLRFDRVDSRSIESTTTHGPALTPTSLRYQARNALRPETPAQEIVRRALNFAVALLGILVAAPLMLLIAIAIRLTSRGPIIYTQPRVGVDRRMPSDSDDRNHRRQQDQGGRIFTI